MRDLLKLFEGWDRNLTVRGRQVDIFRNPTRSDLAKISRQWGSHGYGRLALTKYGDVIIWSAEDALHGEISPHYDFDENLEEAVVHAGRLIFPHAIDHEYETVVRSKSVYEANQAVRRMLGVVKVYFENRDNDVVALTNEILESDYWFDEESDWFDRVNHDQSPQN